MSSHYEESDLAVYPNISYMLVTMCGFAQTAASMELYQLREFMISFISATRQIIQDYDGELELIVGHKIRCFWTHSDEYAFETDKVVAAANSILQNEKIPDVAIGIATGKAFLLENLHVGNIPNLAIELSTVGKPSPGGRCLLCKTTDEHQTTFETIPFHVQNIRSKHKGIFRL